MIQFPLPENINKIKFRLTAAGRGKIPLLLPSVFSPPPTQFRLGLSFSSPSFLFTIAVSISYIRTYFERATPWRFTIVYCIVQVKKSVSFYSQVTATSQNWPRVVVGNVILQIPQEIKCMRVYTVYSDQLDEELALDKVIHSLNNHSLVDGLVQPMQQLLIVKTHKGAFSLLF